MPAVLGAVDAPGLLERSAELEQLALRLRTIRSGTGQLAVITGPAGIGKTSLLNASAALASADCQLLRAQADPVSADATFAAVRELLEPTTRSAPRAVWEGAAERAMPVFAPNELDPLDRDRAASVLHGLYRPSRAAPLLSPGPGRPRGARRRGPHRVPRARGGRGRRSARPVNADTALGPGGGLVGQPSLCDRGLRPRWHTPQHGRKLRPGYQHMARKGSDAGRRFPSSSGDARRRPDHRRRWRPPTS